VAYADNINTGIATVTITGAGDYEGGTGSAKFDIAFTSIANFKTWLEAQTSNNKDTAYHAKLNVDDLKGSVSTAGSLGNVLFTNDSGANAKYVSLDLSGSTTAEIASTAFNACGNLTGITISSNVTSIGTYAFYGCTNLTSVTFGGTGITFVANAFTNGDNLLTAYSSGGAGLYTRSGSTWTKG
jgi:hypothetical protein